MRHLLLTIFITARLFASDQDFNTLSLSIGNSGSQPPYQQITTSLINDADISNESRPSELNYLQDLPHYVSLTNAARQAFPILKNGAIFTLNCGLNSKDKTGSYQYLNHIFFTELMRQEAATVPFEATQSIIDNDDTNLISTHILYPHDHSKINEIKPITTLSGELHLGWSTFKTNDIPFSNEIKGLHYKIDISSWGKQLIKDAGLSELFIEPYVPYMYEYSNNSYSNIKKKDQLYKILVERLNRIEDMFHRNRREFGGGMKDFFIVTLEPYDKNQNYNGFTITIIDPGMFK